MSTISPTYYIREWRLKSVAPGNTFKINEVITLFSLFEDKRQLFILLHFFEDKTSFTYIIDSKVDVYAEVFTEFTYRHINIKLHTYIQSLYIIRKIELTKYNNKWNGKALLPNAPDCVFCSKCSSARGNASSFFKTCFIPISTPITCHFNIITVQKRKIRLFKKSKFRKQKNRNTKNVMI